MKFHSKIAQNVAKLIMCTELSYKFEKIKELETFLAKIFS